MRKLYHHGKDRIADSRSKRRRRAVLILLFVYSVAVVPVTLFWRSLTDAPQINSRTSGQVYTVTKDQGYAVFDEKDFTFKLPSDWTRETAGTTGSPFVYKSGNRTDQARKFEIYAGEVPLGFSPTRLVPVTADGDRIKPGRISDRCHTFTKPKDGFGAGLVSPPLPAEWEGVSFTCNFSSILNIAATANASTGYMTELTGQAGSGSYMFVYTDHSAHPDFAIFDIILKSFRHK